MTRGASPVACWFHDSVRAGVLACACLAALLWPAAGIAQPRFPELTGRIVDEAQLLSEADRQALTDELHALEEKSTDQLVVYTTRSLQGNPIEDFGYQLGRKWQIGQQGKNNGVLLIVAPNERKVRIEVGRGLEPQLTDLMSKLIIENAILPAFRRGDFAAGIKAGVRDIRDVLLGDAEAVAERARWAQAHFRKRRARLADAAPHRGRHPIHALGTISASALHVLRRPLSAPNRP